MGALIQRISTPVLSTAPSVAPRRIPNEDLVASSPLGLGVVGCKTTNTAHLRVAGAKRRLGYVGLILLSPVSLFLFRISICTRLQPHISCAAVTCVDDVITRTVTAIVSSNSSWRRSVQLVNDLVPGIF
jgi:hypothetical protein